MQPRVECGRDVLPGGRRPLCDEHVAPLGRDGLPVETQVPIVAAKRNEASELPRRGLRARAAGLPADAVSGVVFRAGGVLDAICRRVQEEPKVLAAGVAE